MDTRTILIFYFIGTRMTLQRKKPDTHYVVSLLRIVFKLYCYYAVLKLHSQISI